MAGSLDLRSLNGNKSTLLENQTLAGLPLQLIATLDEADIVAARRTKFRSVIHHAIAVVVNTGHAGRIVVAGEQDDHRRGVVSLVLNRRDAVPINVEPGNRPTGVK